MTKKIYAKKKWQRTRVVVEAHQWLQIVAKVKVVDS